MQERKLQTEIIKHLQSKGAYVLKNDASYRQGVPDLSFWHPDLSGMIEVKAHDDSPYRPLQEKTIAKLEAMGIFMRVIHWENWAEHKANFDQWLDVYRAGKLVSVRSEGQTARSANRRG